MFGRLGIIKKKHSLFVGFSWLSSHLKSRHKEEDEEEAPEEIEEVVVAWLIMKDF